MATLTLPETGVEQDAFPINGTDYVEFFVGNAKQASHYYRAAFDWMADHPVSATTLFVKKFFYTWVPVGPSYTLHSALYYRTTIAAYVPLLLLAVLGLPVLVRSSEPPLALGLLAASSVLVCLVFFPHERYRIPVIDPALCTAAAGWLASRTGA